MQQVKWNSLYVAIFVLAAYLQHTFIFNSDVSWLLLASERLGSGGHYLENFFEVNPPLILYLYLPVVWLAKISSLPVASVLNGFFFLLAFVSLSLCANFSKALFKKDLILRRLFLFTVVCVFLILPVSEFGQREHLMVILTLPYFLLKADSEKTFRVHALVIGVMAGLGFAIKPYFLFSWLGVEMYLCMIEKNPFAWLRTETLAVMIVGFIYAVVLLICHQDYLTYMLPWMQGFYYQTFSTSWKSLALSLPALFGYLSFLFFITHYQKLPHRNILTILCIAALGNFISFFLQRNIWFYHYYPLLALNVVLDVIVFYYWIKQVRSFYFFWMSVVCAAIVYFFIRMPYLELSIRLFPETYFCFFGCIFGLIILSDAQVKKTYAFLTMSTILFFCILFKTIVQHSIWQSHLFLLTTAFMCLLFIFFSSEKNKIKLISQIATGCVLFAIPFYEIGNTIFISHAYRKMYENYLSVLKPFANHSVLFLTDNCQYPFPATQYLHMTFTSRLGCFVLPKKPEQQSLRQFMIHALAEDIIKNKPDFIFVDVREKNKKTGLAYFGNNQIDYVKTLSSDALFRQGWKSYQLADELEGQPLYKFYVYKESVLSGSQSGS